MSASILSPADLSAEILTQNLPLSDSFNRATGAGVKQGVHHGLCLSYDDAAWPNGNFGTQYLKLTAGKAILPAVATGARFEDNVFLSAILEADLIIDLLALTSPIIITDPAVYYLVLQVDYTQPTVNALTGLITDIGGNVAKLYIVSSVAGTGLTVKGLLLGKFCRADKYVEMVGESPLSASDVTAEGAFGWTENSNAREKDAPLTYFKRAVNIEQYANLRKHVRIAGLSNIAPTPNNLYQVGSTIMPLADITTTPATALSDINSWTKPVDWSTPVLENLYGAGAGIWKDVEHFELLDCYFRGNFRIAFHRTSGNGVLNTLTNAQKIVDNTIIGLNDYGSKQFVFDGHGSVIEGNMTIDLVLDFVGKAEDHIYRISIKNLEVKGNLTINYGQSFLGLAGGAFGTIKLYNVHADGNTVIQPWPQVGNITAAGLVTAGPYLNYLGSYFANNAQNVPVTGYLTAPTHLSYWRQVGTLVWTKGVIIPCTLIATRSGGGGALAMNGDPFLEEGVDGGIVVEKSVVPYSVMASSLNSCPDISPLSFSALLRVRIKNCVYYQKQVTYTNGYRDAPVCKTVGELTTTAAGISTGAFKNVISGAEVQADTVIRAGTNVIAVAEVQAGTQVRAGTNVLAGAVVQATTNVVALQKVIGITGVTASGGDVEAITGKVKATAGNVEALGAGAEVKGTVVRGGRVISTADVQGVTLDITQQGTIAKGLKSGDIAGSGDCFLRWMELAGNLTAGAGTKTIAVPIGTKTFLYFLILLRSSLGIWVPASNNIVLGGGAYDYFNALYDDSVTGSEVISISDRGAHLTVGTPAYKAIVWYMG